MKRILSFLLILLSTGLMAQTEFESYAWTTIPALNQSDTIESVDGSVVLLERRITEYYLNKENVFEEIYVFHKKIRVETHQAVDGQNKIYIPVHEVIDIMKIEARFIAPNGKITDLRQGSIKEVENLENKGNFKTFAIEGAEVGGQIEYYYILRKKLTTQGGIYIQDNVPKGDVTVLFAYPSKLGFLFKGYNGFPDFRTTSDDKGKSYSKVTAGYIPSLRSEQYANYKASLMRYEFTLAYNYFTGSTRIYSWNKACANIYANLIPLKKNEESAVRSYIRKMNIPETDATTKIRFIENLIKSEISISSDLSQDMDLEDIVRMKQAGKLGILRLFVAIFQAENIPFEVVVTGDMETRPFDPEFNGFNYLDTYLIHFTGIHAFIVPDDANYRLGVIPENYQGAYGLFIHPIGYNDKLKTMAFDIKQIPVSTHIENTDSMYQVIDIDIEKAQLNVKSRRAYYGDVARNFQSFWHFINQDRKDELIKLIFNMGSENTTVETYSVKFDSPENIGLNPIIWDLDITANSLVENAGVDIIVRIGETIGTQAELYQATTRKLPIKVGILHNYYRKIIFNIPAGYSMSDPSELNMKVEMLKDGKTSCIFTSDAKVVDNQLIIVSKEYYADPEYPVSRYDEFRKVINASADFNKKTILLKKI